jgi:hypothetical protein
VTPHLADQICLWSAAIIPILLIARFRVLGVFAGALFVWFALYLAGVWVQSLDPKRDAAMLDSLWLLFGWIGGLIYCLPIFGLRELLWYGYRKYAKAASPPSPEPS